MSRKNICAAMLIIAVFLLPSCIPARDKPVSGQTQPVNGVIKNLSPVGLKAFSYDGGKFTPLEEKQAELIYSGGGSVRKLPLRYYTDDNGGVLISSAIHAQDASDLKDVDLRKALPLGDSFELLYAVAADASRVLLAVSDNGVADTLLADLNTGLVEPLLSSGTPAAPEAEDGLCTARCAPVQLSPEGDKLLFLNGPVNGAYSLMCYDFASGEVSSFAGAALPEGEVFSGCDIRWLDGVSAAVSYPDSPGSLEVYPLSPAARQESLSVMAAASPSVSYEGVYANGWSFEDSGDSLVLTRLSDSYKVNAEAGPSVSGFKPEKVAFSPSGTRAAVFSGDVIYIIELADGGVSEVDAEEKYQSMYETSRPLYWLDEETLLFNSGTMDGGGQLSVTPVLIKSKRPS